MADITNYLMVFINQRSHHWGAPSCTLPRRFLVYPPYIPHQLQIYHDISTISPTKIVVINQLNAIYGAPHGTTLVYPNGDIAMGTWTAWTALCLTSSQGSQGSIVHEQILRFFVVFVEKRQRKPMLSTPTYYQINITYIYNIIYI